MTESSRMDGRRGADRRPNNHPMMVEFEGRFAPSRMRVRVAESMRPSGS